MCGIYGIFSFRDELPLSEGEIRERINILSHRGPNDSGVYMDKTVALGHRRLSIIDLNQGHQPIHNEDQNVWLVYNGEIYNYQELTQQLKSKGHRFYTQSDSEVILHLYEEHGERCVEFLNGIFAFAIWDKREQNLFMARDRLGVKPLFYYQDKNKIIFASEIKAILSDLFLHREINPQALYHYLSLNYIPAPLTMFQNIYALEPGHTLMGSRQGCRKAKYWDLNLNSSLMTNEDDIAEKLRDYLTRSISRQLVSDVPVGAFLSGGIDSSIIVTLMRKKYQGQIKTFNVRFKEESYDESEHAHLMAQKLQTDHHEIMCEAKDYLKYISEIVWHADNLTVDNSMLPLYLVAKLAARDVKVVLSGDGSDELFAGYPTYVADQLLGYYQKLPRFLTHGLIPATIHQLPVSENKMSFEFKAKRFVDGAQLSPQEAHHSWRIIFSEDEKKQLLSKEFFGPNMENTFSVYNRHYQTLPPMDRLLSHQYVDMKVWLADSILAKVDFMSMAHSLEVRVPFLDHEFVEFAAQIPSFLKLRSFAGKYILKKAFARDLPHKIIKRKKSGFNIPIAKWLRGELKDFMLDVLSQGKIKALPFLRYTFIDHMIEEHLNFKKDHSYKLLSLLHFVLWYDKFLKRNY